MNEGAARDDLGALFSGERLRGRGRRKHEGEQEEAQRNAEARANQKRNSQPLNPPYRLVSAPPQTIRYLP